MALAKRARLLALTLLVGFFVVFGAVPASPQVDYSALIQSVAPSVVWIALDLELSGSRIVLGGGSGFITKFDEEGPLMIVTACHVALAASLTATVDGVKSPILAVHPEVASGANRGFPAVVEYCSSLYDVAFLTPIEEAGVDEKRNVIYQRTSLSTYVPRPGRAWLAEEEPKLGSTIFSMGYPGSTDEFNVSFGRVSSKLTQVYLQGSFTEYYAAKENNKCVVKTRLRDDVVFWVDSVGLFGGVPVKWGLDVMRSVLKPQDPIYAYENVGKPVPFETLGSAIWAGRVKEITADGQILVSERAYELEATRQLFGSGCELDIGLFEFPDLRKLTGQVVTLSAERQFYGVDASIRGGNSGGPIFNDRGQLIGMAIFEQRYVEGGNYASNVSDLRKAFEEYATQASR